MPLNSGIQPSDSTGAIQRMYKRQEQVPNFQILNREERECGSVTRLEAV